MNASPRLRRPTGLERLRRWPPGAPLRYPPTMLPYYVARGRWTAFTLLIACSFDGSGLVSVGEPTSTTTNGDTSTVTAEPETATNAQPTTTTGPGGSESDGATMSTTTPVDPTVDPSTTTTTTTDTTTTGPDTTTTTSTGPDTTDTSTTSTDTSTSTGPDTTTGPMCMDPGPEPNEAEDESIDLGDQHCKDPPKKFSGMLDGDTDVDWFRFFGDFSGNSCNDNDPDGTASIIVNTDGPLEVCMFADCDIDGDTVFTCPNGTTSTLSLEGRKGCCGTGSMNYSINCQAGGDESAMLYVRLRNGPADACLEYEVEYNFHVP
ncbi:hypothetical protein [Nannocystis radixulma]|uniref:Uncharacterized protein n=1 Tax=Nannocystis radixulma TaxID=2995305 RepID=A0ABT5BGG1_9BACT|nr:hypothetical protein [Nannocystis radixulma]MDC0673167.1 hypothetical protein [Nannocystis radixulma]